MWQTLTLPWQACIEEAWAAFCAGSIPIGAAVAGPDGTILSRGRNRINEPDGPHGLLFGQTLAHAEINALVCLPADPKLRTTCTLYTTTEPCPLCMGALYMSSVRTVRYAAREAWAGSTDVLGKTPYYSLKPVRAFGPEDAGLENLVAALGVEFELNRRGEEQNHVVAAWRERMPEAVALGRLLFARHELRRLAADQAPAAEMVERVASLAAESV